MSDRVEKAAEWIYRGLWKVLVDWFRVPERPPTLPAAEGEFLLSFHPSRRYLSYLKLYFWIALVLIDGALFVGWIVVLVADPWLGLLLAIPALVIIVVPDIIAYIMIHLRYDTMWYVMTDRSLRCRRGIWVIVEHTITFENVQNVHVRRGPVQYFFGISKVIVETAGSAEREGESTFAVGNKAIMEGIDNPKEIRKLIMERVDRSRSAGLGDETLAAVGSRPSWGAAHREVLREILEEVRALG
jgi:membrane protein YdbS with pleckstrin-like domain